jgi:hypothetical protein
MAAPTNAFVDYGTGNDYKGYPFVDGAYTSATKLLMVTGAFASSKINHWLYLADNGSGNIVDGYYRITAITGTSTVWLNADAGGGSDAVDVVCNSASGTASLPWRSIQGALDLITRDAVNGDQINIKAGTDQVLSATLVLTTYGAPTSATPVIFRGYTTSANDGGIGVIDGAATYAIWLGVSATGNYCHFWDLKMGNCGAAQVITLGHYSTIVNCELHTSTATRGVSYEGTACNIVNCYIHDLSGASNVFFNSAGGGLYYCNIKSAAGTYVVDGYSSPSSIENNIIDISTDTSLTAIYVRGNGSRVMSNTIYTSSAQTVAAIKEDTAGHAIVLNNTIEGYSGAGGIGTHKSTGSVIVLGKNAYFNCTTPETDAGKARYTLSASVTLVASPYVDKAGDNFAIVAGSLAIGAAWPVSLNNLSTTVNAAEIGAVQNGAGSGTTITGVSKSRIIGGL